MRIDDLCQSSQQEAISIDTLWMQDSRMSHHLMVTCCQNNQYLGTSPAIEHIGCRLRRIGRFPHRSSDFNKTCDCIVTSCSSTVIGIAKILSPKSLWNLCWRRLGLGLKTLMLLPLSTSKTKQTCSELRNTLSIEAARFNAHTFCFYHNTHPVILKKGSNLSQNCLVHAVCDQTASCRLSCVDTMHNKTYGTQTIDKVEPCEFAEASPCRENVAVSGAYCKTLLGHSLKSSLRGHAPSLQDTRWVVMTKQSTNFLYKILKIYIAIVMRLYYNIKYGIRYSINNDYSLRRGEYGIQKTFLAQATYALGQKTKSL